MRQVSYNCPLLLNCICKQTLLHHIWLLNLCDHITKLFTKHFFVIIYFHHHAVNLPLAADLWRCVFMSYCSAASRRRHDFLLKLIFHLLSCCHASLWLAQLFQSFEISDVRDQIHKYDPDHMTPCLWIWSIWSSHSPLALGHGTCGDIQPESPLVWLIFGSYSPGLIMVTEGWPNSKSLSGMHGPKLHL